MDAHAAASDEVFEAFVRRERERGTNFVTIVGGEPSLALDRLGRLYTYFTEDEMRTLLTAAGFTGIEADIEPSVSYDGTPANSMHIFATRA